MTAFQLTVTDGIARLVFDAPDAKVNTFSATVVTELNALLDELARRGDVRVLVATSAKKDVFIAGADISELQAIASVEDGYAKARAGQQLFQRVADLPFPSLAVIDGACLGGGLEFALACTWRIATDEAKTKLGLPEVSLGILPGWGGTQRMPRLIGLPQALDLILSGRPLDAKKAFKAGLVDGVCARAFLAEGVERFLAEALTPEGRARIAARRRRPFGQRLLGKAPLRALAVRAARKELLKKTGGRMPAPLAALDVLARTAGAPLAAGLEIEARAFSRLAVTPECRCLIDLFFASEAAKKDGALPGEKPRDLARAGVLGAGVMGGGIAWLFAHQGIGVRVKDLTWEAVAKAYATAHDYNGALVKRRKLTPGEATQRLLRIGGTTDWSGFAHAEVVVEAVVEDLAIKRTVLAEAERHVPAGCVLATNTSSLTVADMAEALERPERFVGMHFFNPVNRMPLVEVVAGPRSSPAAVATIAALARRCGKTAIVVKDCAGFLVNRILLPYLNEAARCAAEGGDIAAIDAALRRFGLPMGPFVLADEIGIDVGWKVARILEAAYGQRMAVAEVLTAVHDRKLLGVKGGAGFYRHRGKQRTPNPDALAAIADVRRVSGDRSALTAAEAVDRCLLAMVNEAARCLEERVVATPALLDLAMVMGTGFPPERGGPCHHADALGARQVVGRLERFADHLGPRFAPCALLVEMARRDLRFFSPEFATLLPAPPQSDASAHAS